MTAERITPSVHTSTAELVNDATAQMSRLVHDELALAKLEMQIKAKRLGTAGALLASALLLARIGLVLAWTLVVVALANVWPLWLAVAVPMAGAFLVAGVLALVGKKRLAKGVPPVPTEAAESVREDLRRAQDAFHEGRQS
ncbi:protein of unknown function DUF1469 [Catenulispora acidiphila DSM 44928]|uniref:Integral membrane protein n=1 Tax=Catenulispora acidiphila (strain DSM 44928 / JCM 14897 / NBRC 102108 / NRRL B-24433 / ID139908) TaxID=479433 RepID=C7PYA7_CATAD|nr:phage holin family protein [Catenulispora acidiphila]ACU75397.1 protein of unknown function DUF1469 [Catenulispora acidiphila DSM 44928]